MARDAYQSISFNQFGEGLNLRDKVDAVNPGEAIDAMNVLFTERGAVEQRPGYGELTTKALTNRPESLSAFYTSGGTKQLLAGCGTRLEALNASGEVVQSATGLTKAMWGFARIGKPNEEVAYAGNGTDTLRKWNAAAWSAPTATVNGEAGKTMPKGRYLAGWGEGENRLVVSGFSTTTGGPGGAESSPSHVWFSDPGNPESWHTNPPEANYVQLTPGDGEAIQAIIAWRQFIFVFKETKFFIFYGVSENEEGAPIFNYRVVEGGAGLVSSRAVCTHYSGVYFLSRQGVFRTTGSASNPEEVSSTISPIFQGDASEFFTGGSLVQGSITNVSMSSFDERIYVSYPTVEANNRTLVYDTRYGWWSLFDLPAVASVSFRPGSSEEFLFAPSSGENKVMRHSSLFTSDNGAAIQSYWRSGWPDFGKADIKKIRARKVWGSGMVQVSASRDFDLGTGSPVLLSLEQSGLTEWDKSTWGGGEWARQRPLIGKESRRAIKGTVFSTFFQNSILNQGWSVHRLEHLVLGLDEPARVTT